MRFMRTRLIARTGGKLLTTLFALWIALLSEVLRLDRHVDVEGWELGRRAGAIRAGDNSLGSWPLLSAAGLKYKARWRIGAGPVAMPRYLGKLYCSIQYYLSKIKLKE
jgi:hypothetical protein